MTTAPEVVREGGTLDFNAHGIAGCCRCGWRGIPAYENGEPSTWCPRCSIAPETDALFKPAPDHVGYKLRRAPAQRPRSVQRVQRNQPCPCGSGTKAKRCCNR